MATLLAEQERLIKELSRAVQAAWGFAPKVFFTEPEEEETEPEDKTPRAYLLLSSSGAGEDADEGSFCTEAINVATSVVLRECPPETKRAGLSDGDRKTLTRAEQLRKALGLKQAMTIWQGFTVRWLTETYRDEDDEYVTLRISLRITVEATLS